MQGTGIIYENDDMSNAAICTVVHYSDSIMSAMRPKSPAIA